MSDELVARLRAKLLELSVQSRGGGSVRKLLYEAADALEAAQRSAEASHLAASQNFAAKASAEAVIHSNAKTFAASIAEERARTADEAALADQLAAAIGQPHGHHGPKTDAVTAALAAHRERRQGTA